MLGEVGWRRHVKRKLLIGGLAILAGGVALRRAGQRRPEAAASVPEPEPPVPPPAAEQERAWQAFLARPCPECGQAAGVVKRTGTKIEERVFEGGGESGRPAYSVLQDERTFYPYYACGNCGAVREAPA
jgi:hypothetical protein